MTPNTSQTHTTNTSPNNSYDVLRAELTDVVKQQLGLHGSQAIKTADALLRGLMERMGGQGIYIPTTPRSERHAAILMDFAGNNAAEVCAKHGISKSTLYRLLTFRDASEPNKAAKPAKIKSRPWDSPDRFGGG